MEPSGGGGLQEGVPYWEFIASLAVLSCFVLNVEDVRSPPPDPAATPSAMMGSSPLESQPRRTLPSLSCLAPGFLSQQKVTDDSIVIHNSMWPSVGCCCLFSFFKTRFFHIALDILELTL